MATATKNPKSQANPEHLAEMLPNNADAERSVLGAILQSNAALLGARELLEPEDFFDMRHIHIFGRMLELHDRDVAIDLVTLTNRLQEEAELDVVGGAPYVASLVDGMARVSNVEHYAKIVKEKSLLRRVIHTAANLQQKAMASEESEVILDDAKNRLSRITELQPKVGLVPIKTIVQGATEHINQIFEDGRHITGLSTGYGGLDSQLAGFHEGELIVLAARPSQGKSSLALNITENLALRQRLAVAFFSLEMSKESLLFRLVSSLKRIDAQKFRTGHLSAADRALIAEGLAEVSGAPLWIDDSSCATVGEIGARAERLKREQDLKLVVVDYLQLVGTAKRFHNRQEEVSDVSRGLKAMSKDLGVPVLALSQLKRLAERDEEPRLSDLRESGAIEQDADVVLFIHRPNLYDRKATPEERDQAELITAKQRNGPIGLVKMVFLGRWTRFEEKETAREMF